MEPTAAPGRRLALVEIAERDGRVVRVVDVHAWPLRLGRAFDNDVVIDDPHVAAFHATLEPQEDGTLQLRVGETVNGVTLGAQHLAAGETATLTSAAHALQLGGLRLRVRLPGEALAAEKPLARARQTVWWVTAGTAALTLLLVAAEHWVTLDPGADATSWLPLLLGLPGAVAAWAGLWALASKLFQHRFDFAAHLRIVLPWLLALQVVDLTLQPLAAALGWPELWRLQPAVQSLIGVLMLRAHLLHVLPASRRTVSLLATSAAVAGLGLSATLTYRNTDRLTRPAYMSTLPLVGLHLPSTVPAASLSQDLAPLAERLAERVRKAQADEDSAGDDNPVD